MKFARPHPNRAARLATLCMCVSAFAASPPTARAELKTGIWRAVVELPGGELPFLIAVGNTGDGQTVFYRNGPEKLEVSEVSFESTPEGEVVILRMPEYISTIRARNLGDRLEGTHTRTKSSGVEETMPFRAMHGQRHRFFAGGEPPEFDFSGRWSVTFTRADGSTYPAVGEFRQKGTRVLGTFLTEGGDYRQLAGDASGTELRLSRFDGGDIYLFVATADEDDRLQGDYWSGTTYHLTWTAARDSTASLEGSDVHIKEGMEFGFSFPNLSGETVSLDDDRFDGKVVIVTIGGSWCGNCHDEAPFLSRLYDAYHKDGLEVVGVMFEPFRDIDRVAAQVARFQKKHDIPFDLLVAGHTDKKEVLAALPALSAVKAYPTTVIIDRRGEVRRIITGFVGPGAGPRFVEYQQEFAEFILSLLEESS